MERRPCRHGWSRQHRFRRVLLLVHRRQRRLPNTASARLRRRILRGALPAASHRTRPVAVAFTAATAFHCWEQHRRGFGRRRAQKGRQQDQGAKARGTCHGRVGTIKPLRLTQEAKSVLCDASCNNRVHSGRQAFDENTQALSSAWKGSILARPGARPIPRAS